MNDEHSNTAVETPPAPPEPKKVDPGSNGHGHKLAQPVGEHDLPQDLHKPSNWVVILVVIVFVGLLAALFVVGFVPYTHEKSTAEASAQALAQSLPTVVVQNPAPPAAQNSVKLPASLVAERLTDIYSRANGYLVKNECEINDIVKENQELALIEAPDIEAQLKVDEANLHQAQANVIKAQADLDIANITLARYQNWFNSGSGGETQQDIDDKKAVVRDAEATLEQMKASVDTANGAIQATQTQLGFNRVLAPYTGMITDRQYDPGALLQASNTTQPRMFQIEDIDTLRAFVSVPQNYASQIQQERIPGPPGERDDKEPEILAYLTVTNFPGVKFPGHVRRMRGNIDPNTRTMQFLVRFENKDHRLFPGMYGEIEIPLVNNSPVLIIPSSAMIFDANGLKVAVVDDQKKIQFKKIAVGRDLGTQLEVTQGLVTSDQVVTNPGERIVEGTEVIVTQKAPAPQPVQPQKSASTEPATQPAVAAALK